ncbi:EfeM/EfeO family lipoprotein [Vibrio artabrorum]|nr:EfeM/EfeO family lipoprotein [Vibrio artabrorum]
MNNRAKTLIKLSCIALFLTSSYCIQAKALRAPIQTGSDVIVAKGDIPTPDRYKPATHAFMTYTVNNIDAIISLLKKVRVSINNNNLIDAQNDYVKAHQHYEMIRPIVGLFGHTDRVINARADYFLKGERDYRFKGFHLIEYLLFKTKDTPAALDAIDELLMLITDLKQRVEKEHIEIPKLVQSSADYLEMILEVKLNGQESIYSHSDLSDMAANILGSQTIIDEIEPFISPQTLKPIVKNYQKINQILNQYATEQGHFRSYEKLASYDKKKLYSLLSNQAYLLATLRSNLNLDVYYKYEAEAL